MRRPFNRLRIALVAAAATGALLPVSAQAGFLDFLFGPQRQGPPAAAESYAEPSAPAAPAPLGQENVRQGGGSTGHAVAFCVRLCDGQNFPLEHLPNATPVETCRAMCPASRTEVFYGSDISTAAAKNGARYADLDNAFVYRKQLVANCTCNGKDAFGLAPFDLSSDPTLRPGDIVSTKQGLMAFTGRNAGVAQFTPVAMASIATQLNSITTNVATRRGAPETENAPGRIAMQQPAPPLNLGANPRAQAAR